MKRASLTLFALAVAATCYSQELNEFSSNPPGTDPSTQDIELRGIPTVPFSGWILSFESDFGTGAGTVDRATMVFGVFDINGLLVVNIPDLENPSFTLALTSEFLGSVGTDYDVDDDGVLDSLSDFGVLYDALGVPDTTGEILYGAQLGGQDFAYTGQEPELLFRDSISGDWVAVNSFSAGDVAGNIFDVNANEIAPGSFNADPTIPTFGAVNPTAVPEPGAYAMLLAGLGLVVVAIRRVRRRP